MRPAHRVVPALVVVEHEVLVVLLVPAVLPGPRLASGENTDDPRLLSCWSPSPVLLEIVLAGLDASSGQLNDHPDHGVESSVHEETTSKLSDVIQAKLLGHLRNQAIGNAVAERDEGNSDERWNGIANVVPVHGTNLSDHQAADLLGVSKAPTTSRSWRRESYKDQCAPSGPGRNRCKDRGEKNRGQETEAGDDGSETSAAAFRNSSAALNKSGNRRASEERADGDAKGIGAIGHG